MTSRERMDALMDGWTEDEKRKSEMDGQTEEQMDGQNDRWTVPRQKENWKENWMDGGMDGCTCELMTSHEWLDGLMMRQDNWKDN